MRNKTLLDNRWADLFAERRAIWKSFLLSTLSFAPSVPELGRSPAGNVQNAF